MLWMVGRELVPEAVAEALPASVASIIAVSTAAMVLFRRSCSRPEPYLLDAAGMAQLDGELKARSSSVRVSAAWQWTCIGSPFGAGGRFVRLNGLVFEAVRAALEHRPRLDLYHAALEVCMRDARFVIEVAPLRTRRRG
jgi:hypothetical protein